MGRFIEIFSLYELACVLLPCLLYAACRRAKERRAGRRIPGVYLGWICAFWVYLWMVFNVTGVGTLEDIMRNMPDVIMGGVNLVPFDSLGIGLALNVVMFMPFGFLLPLIFKDSRSFWKTVSAGAVLSLTIELSQLLNYRTTDVDDLMANTCGACIGYLVWHAFTKIAGERLFAAEERKREALRYVFLAMAGVFFLYRPLSVVNRMM